MHNFQLPLLSRRLHATCVHSTRRRPFRKLQEHKDDTISHKDSRLRSANKSSSQVQSETLITAGSGIMRVSTLRKWLMKKHNRQLFPCALWAVGRTKKEENKRDNYISNAKTLPLWHLVLAEQELQHVVIFKFQLELLRKKSRSQSHYSCFSISVLFSRVPNGPPEPRSSLKAGSRSAVEFFLYFQRKSHFKSSQSTR